MPTLATLLCAILSDITTAIGVFMDTRARIQPAVWIGTRLFVPAPPQPATPPVPSEILALARKRIARMAQRFARLYERWTTNTLPKPRPSQAGQTRPERPRQPPLPRRRAWLAGGTDYRVRGQIGRLRHLLAQPDAEAFMQAVPRAGRILRPLCHMLGIDLPAPIILPPRPRKPRPRPEKPPREPRRQGKHTMAQIRRYSPGRMPG